MRSLLLPPLLAIAVLSLSAGCKRPADPVAKAPPAPTAVPPIAPLPPVEEGQPPPRGKHIAIVYSSNIFGEYEPCG